ncbi:MAG: GNAT family N-acetyltransferase [Cyclobacteriaceae bacterium]
MKPDFMIREVCKSDMDQLIELCRQHADYEQNEYNPNGKFIRLTALLFNDNPPLKCRVAETDGVLIGYVTFMKQFSTWDASYYVYMDCLFLTEDTRGKGIGKELMNEVVRYAESEYCKEVQWQTPTFNSKAIRFYRNYGAFSKEKERFFLDLST